MSIGEICNREVIIANREDSVFDAARLMRQYHVGDIVVVDRAGSGNIPVGILTDRDITIEIVAMDVNAKDIKVSDIMSQDILVAREEDEITDLLQLMQSKGVRRVPVVSSSGALIGIITESDLLDLIREQLGSLVGIEKKGEQREQSTRI